MSTQQSQEDSAKNLRPNGGCTLGIRPVNNPMVAHAKVVRLSGEIRIWFSTATCYIRMANVHGQYSNSRLKEEKSINVKEKLLEGIDKETKLSLGQGVIPWRTFF